MTPGTRVRMSEKLKEQFRANDCGEHVTEFGDCLGIVVDLIYDGHYVDVRWQPSNLRYAYAAENLIIVEDLIQA